MADVENARTPSPPPARAPLPLWKRLLFTLVLLVITLGTLELVAQVYLRTQRGYAGGSFLQYQFDPYKNILPVPNWVDTRGVKHNAQGFRRSTDVSREKPAGVYRIFLMGASTAYGTGGLWPHIDRGFEVLDNTETIDFYLEEQLERDLGREVEVINAAIPSIQTHHHLIYLNQTILGYDPDMVIFLDGLNDHYYYYRSHDQFADYAYTEASHVIMGPPTLAALVRANLWWLFRKSAFIHVGVRAGQGLKQLIVGRDPDPPIDVERALVDLEWVFQRNALKMIERNALILRQEGIPTLITLQPMLILERERLPRMPEIEQHLFEFDVQEKAANHEEFARRAVPIVARLIEEKVTPLGAEFIDLTGIYKEAQGQVFTDYAHLTPDANRLLAGVLAERVEAMMAGTSAPPEG